MALVIRAKDDPQTVIATADEETDDVVVLEDNWYFSPDCVDMSYLEKSDHLYTCPYKGQAIWYNLDTPDIQAEHIAWCYENPVDEYDHIAGKIAFYSRETSATIANKEETAANA